MTPFTMCSYVIYMYIYFIPYAYEMSHAHILYMHKGYPVCVWDDLVSHMCMGVLYAYGQ